jgi:hypothetical protein
MGESAESITRWPERGVTPRRSRPLVQSCAHLTHPALHANCPTGATASSRPYAMIFRHRTRSVHAVAAGGRRAGHRSRQLGADGHGSAQLWPVRALSAIVPTRAARCARNCGCGRSHARTTPPYDVSVLACFQPDRCVALPRLRPATRGSHTRRRRGSGCRRLPARRTRGTHTAQPTTVAVNGAAGESRIPSCCAACNCTSRLLRGHRGTLTGARADIHPTRQRR